MHQVVQVAGALAILTAFALAQFGVVNPRAWSYLWLNLVGSFVLAVDAWREDQWGFFLLEGAWAVISAWGVVAKVTGREAPGAH
jgi:hypothetical protein